MRVKTNTTPDTCLEGHARSACYNLVEARRLLAAGLVVAEDDGSYTVRSESDLDYGYIVTPRNGSHPAACTCSDYDRRRQEGARCVHLEAARLAEVQLRERQRQTAAELAAEEAAPKPPPQPKKRRGRGVKIRRPSIAQDQRALRQRLARFEGEQVQLRREALCGTVADDWPAAEDPAHP